MRSIILVALIACTGFFTACEKTNSEKTGPDKTDGSSVKVKLHDCFTTVFSGTSVELCFDSIISDSRCPANATCIWQGAATCKFSLQIDNDTHILTLSTVKMGSLIKDTTISGYKIEFLDLEPYPGSSSLPTPVNNIKAVVRVTKP